MGRHAKPAPMKTCESCGMVMERKRYGDDRLEDLGAFNRRKYCSIACLAIGKTKENPTISALRHRARRFREDRCEQCGATEKLHLHHRDGNPANNEPENRQTLCGSCHLTMHWEQWRTSGSFHPGPAD